MHTILEILRFPCATPRRAAIVLPLALAWPFLIERLPALVHRLFP